MYISLSSARGLFSHMQDSLRHVEGKRVALTRGIHQALAELWWLAEDLSRLPTRLYDLVPPYTIMDGYNDAPEYICVGSVLPVPM